MSNVAHTIPPKLVKAYREAVYVIHGDHENISLKVGQPHDGLSELMRGYGVSSAAFLTAFNPYSALSDAIKNERRHGALIADLNGLGLKHIAGKGGDAANLWPSEPSVLVLDISLQNAELLADRYEQNAFLWISDDDGLVHLNLRYPVSTFSLEDRVNES